MLLCRYYEPGLSVTATKLSYLTFLKIDMQRTLLKESVTFL